MCANPIVNLGDIFKEHDLLPSVQIKWILKAEASEEEQYSLVEETESILNLELNQESEGFLPVEESPLFNAIENENSLQENAITMYEFQESSSNSFKELEDKESLSNNFLEEDYSSDLLKEIEAINSSVNLQNHLTNSDEEYLINAQRTSFRSMANSSTHGTIQRLESADHSEVVATYEKIFSKATEKQIRALSNAPNLNALTKELEYLLIQELEQEYLMVDYQELFKLISPEQRRIIEQETSPDKLQALLIEVLDAVQQNIESFNLLDQLLMNSNDADIEALLSSQSDEEIIVALYNLQKNHMDRQTGNNSFRAIPLAIPVVAPWVVAAGKAIIAGVGVVGGAYVGGKIASRAKTVVRQAAARRSTQLANHLIQRNYRSQVRKSAVRQSARLTSSLVGKTFTQMNLARQKSINNARLNQMQRAQTQVQANSMRTAQTVVQRLQQQRMIENNRVQRQAERTFTGNSAQLYSPAYSRPAVAIKVPTQIHQVSSGESVYGIARQYGITREELITWNQIKNYTIHPSQKLIVQQTKPEQVTTNQPKIHVVSRGDTLYNIASRNQISVTDLKKWNNLINTAVYPGDQLVVSAPRKSQGSIISGLTYTVRPNDSLWRIAQIYGVTLSDLVDWNQLKSYSIHPGDKLVVAQPSGISLKQNEVYQVKSGDSLWRIAQENKVTVDELVKWNGIVGNLIHPGDQLVVSKSKINIIPVEDRSINYIVKPSDTLWRIANSFGIPLSELIIANQLKSDVIKVGQPLIIPRPGVRTLSQASITYTVKQGDTLWSVSQKYGLTVSQLMIWNSLNSTQIRVGQQISIHQQKTMVESIPVPETKPIITTTPQAQIEPLVIRTPPELIDKDYISILPIEEGYPMLEIFPRTSEEDMGWLLSYFWDQTTEFRGIKVYQRDDIFDPMRVDYNKRTNLQRMREGLAPIGHDGKSVNLHHMTQRNTSSIAEMTQTFHQKHTKIIHINPKTIPSGIDRTQFATWRRNYWKERARRIEEN